MNKTKNKWVVSAASAALVASAIVPVASAASFSDIENNDHKDAILALAEAGIISGYTDGTFKPNAVVTRGNVTKLLGKWLVSEGYEIPEDYKTVARFDDLATDSVDQELVQYAALVKDAGVFKGSNNKLMQANNMSREQMAVVLVRALNTVYGVDLVADYKAADFESKITDLDKANADENREAIIALEYAELTKVTAFNPKNSLTRGQFASFLHRAITNVAPEEAELKVESVTAVNGSLTVKLAEAAKEVSVEDFKVSQAINGGTATEVTPSAVVLSEDGLTATLTVDQVVAAETTNQSVVYTVNEVAAPAFVVEASTLAVESVKAINATQVVVEFNKAVDKDTVIDSTSKAVKNVTFKSLDGKVVENATGELSKDGKTLTITAGKATTGGAQTVFEGRYDITIDKVKDTNGKDVVKYEAKNVDFGKDTAAPTILNVEKVNSSKVKVNFSEPLSVEGNWTFTDAKGDAVAVTKSFTTGDSAVVLTIDGAIKAGTEITATVIGAKDQAGNLINPNPTSVKFTKGDKDSVAPEVTEVTAKGLNKFEIKFSEEVQGLALENILVDGTALTSADVAVVDKDDKTKYNVELNSALAAGLHKVEVKSTTNSPVTDLSGEALKDFSKLVEFKADTLAPKFVKSEIVVDATTKEEKLVLTFDKEIKEPASFTTAATAAIELNKDLVTTEGKLTAGQLTVNAKDKKQLEVALKTVKFTPANGTEASLAKDATYTVKFAKGFIADTNTTANQAEAFTITFKRGEDGTATTSDKPEVTSVTATDSNTVTVVFDKEVDGVSATTAANYAISGLEIEKAALSKDTNGVANTVTLTLKKGTNTLDGDRDLTIQNVKAKNGVVMDTVTKTVANMKENVAPTVVTAKYTNTTAGEVTELTLTFSEAVTVSADAFELFVGDSTTGTSVTNTAVTSAAKEVKVTVKLSADQIAKGITVKLADGAIVKDGNLNELDFTSIKAAY
ncbi:S-layer homology domain-containing protein [Lysinibacillus sp. NPDC096418]|uniref:S-layer homology domain-containing protein n=1 Tax=Lysinibacillus sp. NPDC096418 TaxID=3364138 RepID=UPI0037F1E4AA